PIQQRFLTRDPAPPNPKSSQALNPYAYVFHNPLNWTDPTGFDGVPVWTPDPLDYVSVPSSGNNAAPIYEAPPANYVEVTSGNQSVGATQGYDGSRGPYDSDVPFGPFPPGVIVVGPGNDAADSHS